MYVILYYYTTCSIKFQAIKQISNEKIKVLIVSGKKGYNFKNEQLEIVE